MICRSNAPSREHQGARSRSDSTSIVFFDPVRAHISDLLKVLPGFHSITGLLINIHDILISFHEIRFKIYRHLKTLQRIFVSTQIHFDIFLLLRQSAWAHVLTALESCRRRACQSLPSYRGGQSCVSLSANSLCH